MYQQTGAEKPDFFWTERNLHNPFMNNYIYLSEKMNLEIVVRVPTSTITLSKGSFNEITASGRSCLNEVIEKCDQENIAIKKQEDAYALLEGNHVINGIEFQNEDIKILADFLYLVHKVMFFSDKMREEIKTALNLNQVADKEFLEENKLKIDRGDIADALKAANVIENGEGLWSLGQYCENKGLLNDAVDFYQTIDNNALFYAKANYQSAYLLMTNLENNSFPEEKRKNIENIMRFLLRANQSGEYQKEVDRFFHQLCGDNNKQPTIKNVKSDESTLVQLAQVIADLRQVKEAVPQEMKKSNPVYVSSNHEHCSFFKPQLGEKTFQGNKSNIFDEAYPQFQYD
ncbi:hypothetical protein [Legionella fairfieldensis]|uniref:hypothetical protein n=1 Tax=Legionella fairfieldensis TaxID=45064 RepID=UPI00049167BA|nr:hypothetical protein [Legionella fairfieldensis]